MVENRHLTLASLKGRYITAPNRHLFMINDHLSILYVKRLYTGLTRQVTMIFALHPSNAKQEQLIQVTYLNSHRVTTVNIISLTDVKLPTYTGKVNPEIKYEPYKHIMQYLNQHRFGLFELPTIRAILHRDGSGQVTFAATNYHAEDFNQYVPVTLSIDETDRVIITFKGKTYGMTKFMKAFRKEMDGEIKTHANDLYVDYVHHLNLAVDTFRSWSKETHEPKLDIIRCPVLS